jgi:hypothetical protein
VARGAAHAWIGTGAEAGARVFRSGDAGRTWAVATTPVVSGRFAGIAALAVRDTLRGVALGGRLDQPDAFWDNVAATVDGGRTWTLLGHPPFPGPVYGAAFAWGVRPALVAVGPGGLAVSRDEARTWTKLDSAAHWAVGFGGSRVGWAVGPEGRITRIVLR